MAQVVIRKIDDEAMARLKARARRKGVSLEQELRTILIETPARMRPGSATAPPPFGGSWPAAGTAIARG